jgi:hypothetical protein
LLLPFYGAATNVLVDRAARDTEGVTVRTYIRKADRVQRVKLIHAERLGNSRNGNPRYRFAVAGEWGSTLTLATDSGYGYEVTSHSFPRWADVHLTPGGRVEFVTELTQDQRIEARVAERQVELDDGWQYAMVYDREALMIIQSLDPSGAMAEPTEALYAAHRAWALGQYGEDIWVTYAAGGWGTRPEV